MATLTWATKKMTVCGSCTSKMAHGHCPRMKCCTCTRSTVEEHINTAQLLFHAT